jgi:hypothetical protein
LAPFLGLGTSTFAGGTVTQAAGPLIRPRRDRFFGGLGNREKAAAGSGSR